MILCILSYPGYPHVWCAKPHVRHHVRIIEDKKDILTGHTMPSHAIPCSPWFFAPKKEASLQLGHAAPSEVYPTPHRNAAAGAGSSSYNGFIGPSIGKPMVKLGMGQILGPKSGVLCDGLHMLNSTIIPWHQNMSFHVDTLITSTFLMVAFSRFNPADATNFASLPRFTALLVLRLRRQNISQGNQWLAFPGRCVYPYVSL